MCVTVSIAKLLDALGTKTPSKAYWKVRTVRSRTFAILKTLGSHRTRWRTACTLSDRQSVRITLIIINITHLWIHYLAGSSTRASTHRIRGRHLKMVWAILLMRSLRIGLIWITLCTCLKCMTWRAISRNGRKETKLGLWSGNLNNITL